MFLQEKIFREQMEVLLRTGNLFNKAMSDYLQFNLVNNIRIRRWLIKFLLYMLCRKKLGSMMHMKNNLTWLLFFGSFILIKIYELLSTISNKNTHSKCK
jgi:hypothetical protein